METSPDQTIMPLQPRTSARTALCIIDPASAELFSLHYNRVSFRFEHGLNGHPLLDLSSLVKLSARHRDDSGYAYLCIGRVEVNGGWDAGRPQSLSLQQTVAQIANDDSLVILEHVEEDSVLGPLVKDCIATVVDMVGPQMRDDVIVARGTLLIASPRRVTPYHIDADVNFLFQVAGDKLTRVFDQTDRTLLTHPMLEKYYRGDISGAQFAASRDGEPVCGSCMLARECTFHAPHHRRAFGFLNTVAERVGVMSCLPCAIVTFIWPLSEGPLPVASCMGSAPLWIAQARSPSIIQSKFQGTSRKWRTALKAVSD